MLTQIINGKIFTPQGWLDEGSVLIRDNKILEVTNCDLALIGAKLIDAKGMYIVPGYVCMHAHGGGGHDFNECTEEAFRAAVKAHQKHGATSIFPTLSSSPFSEIRKAVAVCETLMNEKDSPVLGLHVEGPYLNPKRAGEQFAGKLKNPDKEEYTSLLESTDCIKRWDASPELPDALEFARYLKSKGILVAVSHTESEYEGIKAAFEAGFTHTAHFYNGMPGFHKCREYKYEGTVESVYLTDGMTIELIADGIHLPATILRLAYKLKGVEKTCLVTDALAYAAADGMEITDPNVIIEDGVCKMADHSSLAGSIATMDVLVRTMVKAGIPLAEAVRSVDGTVKYLYRVGEGHYVEAVYIPEEDRATLCVSSQVGCKMNCKFCMTGKQGFTGNLTAGQIINQINSLPERDKLTNVVMMGMGEPLDNLNEVLKALEVMTASYGYGWSPKRVTLSSVGLRKGLQRFVEESDCHLAISLHSPVPQQRRELMPAEKAFSITEIVELLRNYDFSKQRRLSFEYIVFKGVNDSLLYAKELLKLLRGLDCRINLIQIGRAHV